MPRPKGSKNKATTEQRKRIKDLAQEYAPEALQTLKEIATGDHSPSARVAAANSLLDRGFGRPSPMVETDPSVERLEIRFDNVLNITPGESRDVIRSEPAADSKADEA